MLNNFIYTEKKQWFEINLKVGNIPDDAIVFIEDTKEIWNHGTYFDCSPEHATKQELQDYSDMANETFATKTDVNTELAKKVDKVEGKQLSTEDFTTDLKTRLEGLNIYKKIYRQLQSLPSESSGWYTIAKIDDTESSLFQVSTGGHSDVIFTVSTGWGGNPSGSLTILNSFYSSETGDVNGYHTHVKQVRIRKYNNKLHVDLNLNKPTSNGENYVNIVVSVFTNAGHDLLENELVLSDSQGTVVQTFALQNQAIMADKVVANNVQIGDYQAVTTKTLEDYTTTENLPVKNISSTEKVLYLTTNGVLSSSLSYTREAVDGVDSLVLKGKNNEVLGSVPVADFVVDGMLQNVELNGDKLVFTFNITVDPDGENGEKEPTQVIEVDLKKYINVYTGKTDEVVVSESGEISLSNPFTTAQKEALESALQQSDLNGYATQQWVKDQNYLTEHQDISGKQDIITDLEDIRTNAESAVKSADLESAITNLKNELQEIIIDDERVIAEAFNDLNNRINILDEKLQTWDWEEFD